MQMCQPHWAELRAEVDRRGLTHLVSQSGKSAADKAVAELTQPAIESQQAKAERFDPLLNANWAICGQFITNIGLAAMEGNQCPLCEVEASAEGRAQNWIQGAVEDQHAYATEVGLMSKSGVQ